VIHADPDNPAAKAALFGREEAAHSTVEIGGTNAVVANAENSAAAGETHLMVRPAPRRKLIEQRALVLLDIAVEEGPDVIAAKALSLFDQQNRNVAPAANHGDGSKASRQPASGNDQRRLGGIHARAITAGMAAA
jgi:hypothetical protein